jgi:Ca-activated chloride channel family protein
MTNSWTKAAFCRQAMRLWCIGLEDPLQIALADRGGVPDRDFVLRWAEGNAEAVAPRVWVREKDSETYALLEIRAPRRAPSDRSPVDFYFLVDRSGSMAGEKWNKAAEALQSCLRVLDQADRAMITFFETRFQDFAECPLPVGELVEDRGFQAVQRLGTGGGG